MSLLTRIRKQTAVYWGQLAPDAYGKATFDLPVEIACRWEDKMEEVVTSDGTRATSRSMVYVDRQMRAGDVLFRGTLQELQQLHPETLHITPDVVGPAAFPILRFDAIPNLRMTETLLLAYA